MTPDPSPHTHVQIEVVETAYADFPRKQRLQTLFDNRADPTTRSELLRLIAEEHRKHDCTFLALLLGSLHRPEDMPFLEAALQSPCSTLVEQTFHEITRRDFCRQNSGNPSQYEGAAHARLRSILTPIAIAEMGWIEGRYQPALSPNISYVALKFLVSNPGPEIEEGVRAYLPRANLLTQDSNVRAMLLLLAYLKMPDAMLHEECIRAVSQLALDVFQTPEVRDHAYAVLDAVLSKDNASLSPALRTDLIQKLCDTCQAPYFCASRDRRDVALDSFFLLRHFKDTDPQAETHARAVLRQIVEPVLQRALGWLWDQEPVSEEQIFEHLQEAVRQNNAYDAFVFLKRRLPEELQVRALQALGRWVEGSRNLDHEFSEAIVMGWKQASIYLIRRFQLELNNPPLEKFILNHRAQDGETSIRFKLAVAVEFGDLRVPPPPFLYVDLGKLGPLISTLETVKREVAEQPASQLHVLAKACMQRLLVDGPRAYGLDFSVEAEDNRSA